MPTKTTKRPTSTKKPQKGQLYVRLFDIEVQRGKSKKAMGALQTSVIDALRGHEGYRGFQLYGRPGSRFARIAVWFEYCGQPKEFFNKAVRTVRPDVDGLRGINIDESLYEVLFEDPAGLVTGGAFIPARGSRL